MNSFPSLYETFPTSCDNLLPIIVPLLFIFTAYVFLIKGARRSKHLKIPRYDAIPNSSVKQIPSRKALRDLSGNIDVAIIGSGIGALSNAAVLARQGYKVAVFEQNQTVGGCTHTFEKGSFVFDVGVHYVGGFSSVVRDMYDNLSDGQLKWSKIDRTYDVMYNDKTGERIEVTDDHGEYRKKLTEHFGIDKATWKKFDKACFCAKFWSYVVLQLKLWHPMVLWFVWPLVTIPYKRYALQSTTDALNEIGFTPEAAGAIVYHWGDHGVPPAKCPFFMTALLDGHYKGGAYFPRGGSASIAKTLTASILRRGGHVFALSPVEKIITKKNLLQQDKAVGVRVHGIDIHVKSFVVSDAGFLATFGTDSNATGLVNADVGAKQRALVQHHVSPCISDLSLFIGLNKSDDELNLPAQNIWHLSKDYGWNHDKAFDAMLNDSSPDAKNIDHTPFLFISNESAKDPDFALTHPGKSTSEVIGIVKADIFKQWDNTTHESRGDEYLVMKEKITQRYLQAFYMHFPQAKGHVCYTSLGTPLTMNKLLGRTQGEVYALDHDISRFDSYNVQRALHPQTLVKNLYLTGEDSFVVSVTASMLSGYITAVRCSWRSWFEYLPLAKIMFG